MTGSVVLVSGLPGVGKTTIARALATAAPRGVHLDSDDIGESFIVSGLVVPGAEPADEAERQLALRRENLFALSRNFTAAGFDVAISDVVLWPGLLRAYRIGVFAPLRFVLLTASPETVSARDAGRDKQVAAAWTHLRAAQDAWRAPGLRIDTTTLTAEATLEAIHDGWDAALV